MALQILQLLMLLVLSLAAVGWIVWALVALIRRQRPIWLLAGVPVALLVGIYTVPELREYLLRASPIVSLLTLLVLSLSAVVWIARAVVAAMRQRGQDWLYAGAPVAIIVGIYAVPKLAYLALVFAIAAVNGGTGR